MKKSLIALAVAGAFAAPAFAASSNVDVYGTIRMSVDHVTRDGANNDGYAINDQTSRFGIKGSEDLGGGLKAVWQIEQQIKSDVAGTFGGQDLRNTFVGVAGNFGTVLIGRHDTPYKLGGSADVFADTAADSQKNGTGIIGRNGFDNRAANTVAYISPDWSGFHFAAAVIPGEENVGGAGAVTGFGNDAQGLMDAYSLVGVYANGPLKATLGHERFGKKLNTVAGGAAATDQNKAATKFNIAYKIGDIGLGYTYERSDDGYASTAKTDKAHLASITYGMGPITLAGQYGKFNNDQADTAAVDASGNYNNADLSRWTIGAIYNLSKRTNAYAAYNHDNYTGTAEDAKVWTVGLNHSF